MIIGLVPAFNEAPNIEAAVGSLFGVGCGRVVVMDGAYLYPDGSSFLDGGCESTDGMGQLARDAGAEVIVPSVQPRFGQKRDLLLWLCGATAADHVLFLDADERAVGRFGELPDGHACVLLRNLKPNDLPDMRGEWPHGDAGPVVPLLRLLRWSEGLRFVGPGEFEVDGVPVAPYDSDALARDELCPLEEACALPILAGVQIHHSAVASAERVAAKRVAYSR